VNGEHGLVKKEGIDISKDIEIHKSKPIKSSIGINRFNRNWFGLTRLMFHNGALFQPFWVETR